MSNRFKRFFIYSFSLTFFLFTSSSLQASENLKDEEKEISLNRSVEKSPIILKIDELIEFIENSSDQKKDSGLKTLTSVASTSTTAIRLKSLECILVQDPNNKDECQLDIYEDTNYYKYKQDMKAGDLWLGLPIQEKTFYYKSSLNIKLYENDEDGNARELLGEVKMYPGQGDGNHHFNNHRAHYLLKWKRV